MIQILNLIKNRYLWIGIIVVLVGFYVMFLRLENSKLVNEVQEYSNQVDVLELKLSDTEARFDEANNQVQDLKEDIKTKDKLIEFLNDKRNSTSQNIDDNEIEISKMRTENEEIDEYLGTDIPDDLYKRLQSLYQD